MILTAEEYSFIERIQEKFPDKKILANFDEFLKTYPEDRYSLAKQKQKELPRTGYVIRGIDPAEAETVYEHTEDAIEMAKQTIPEWMAEQLPILIAILDVHDIGEAIVGDFTPFDDISKEDKKELERLAVAVIAEGDREIMKNWQDYEEGTSVAGLFSKDLDKLQMYKKSVAYGNEYPDVNLNDILDRVNKQDWFTSTGKEIFKSLRVLTVAPPRMMTLAPKPV
jgi:5'-deoxynucleotidase YfbR-like HD superfamily hydrolase